MAEIEFRVDEKALAVVQSAQVSANFEECRAVLTEMMAPYASMKITEDDIPNAKADRAKIRKVKERLEDARKMVKKVYNEPLAAFEGKCKELTAICDEAAGNLDGQLKLFDEQRKAAKIEDLKSYFSEKSAGVSDFLTWEDVFDPRWGNVTYTEEQAHNDMMAKIAMTTSALVAIRGMNSPFETELLDTYRQSHDMTVVVRKNEYLLELRRKEELKKAAEAAKATETPPLAETKPEVKEETVLEASTPSKAEKLLTIDFRVRATSDQLNALSAFMKSKGIFYGPVPKGDT